MPSIGFYFSGSDVGHRKTLKTRILDVNFVFKVVRCALVSGFGFRVEAFGLSKTLAVLGLGFRVEGFGLKLSGFAEPCLFRVQG